MAGSHSPNLFREQNYENISAYTNVPRHIVSTAARLNLSVRDLCQNL